MNLENEIQKMREEHAQKEAELVREYAIRQYFQKWVEAGYAAPSVFFSKLYGRRGVVTFRLQRYESIKKGGNPNADLLRELLAAFPGVPMVQYRDGCVGFRPEVSALEAEASDKAKGRKPQLTEVGPVTVQLEPSQYSQTAKFEWTAVLGEELWEINVEFPLYSVDLGTLRVEYDRYGDGEIRAIRHCDLICHAPAQRIRYASGDSKTPNTFVVYWDRDSASTLDYGAFIK